MSDGTDKGGSAGGGAGAAFRDLLLWPLAAAAAFAWSLDIAEAQGDAQTPQEEQGVTRTLSPIDWPRVQSEAAEAGAPNVAPGGGGLASFEGSGRNSADNLQLPVLLPSSLIAANEAGELDEPLELLARTNDFSAEAKRGPRSYLIQGTRYVFQAPEGAAEPAPEVQAEEASDPVTVEKSEYGISATFQRYGAVYTIEIFCALPPADAECNDEAKVRELAAEMTFVP